MIYPLVENSGDINIYQKFEEKASRINDLFSYQSKDGIFDVGEVDPKEKKLMLLTDPEQKADLSIKIDLQKIQADKLFISGEIDSLEKLRDKKSDASISISRLKESVDIYK